MYSVFVSDKEYRIHFSSVTPDDLRFRLLNVDSNERVKLSIWYSRSNRLDVFVADTYVQPTNTRLENGRYVSKTARGYKYDFLFIT